MERYTNTILNKQGKPVVGAVVTVTKYPSNEPATIYAEDGGRPVESISSDVNGRFAFYAADGHYNLSVTGRHIDPFTITDIVLNDPSDEAFQQAGSGAVPRKVQDKLRELVSVKDFGAVGDGITNDTVAIQYALSAMQVLGGGALYFPAGRYRVAAGVLSISGVAITIYGDGMNNTRIQSSAGAGNILTITQQDFTAPIFVHDLSIITYTQEAHTGLRIVGNAADSQLNRVQARCEVRNVEVRGDDVSRAGPLDGIVISNCHNLLLSKIYVSGRNDGSGTRAGMTKMSAGVRIVGSSTGIPSDFTIQGCYLYHGVYGFHLSGGIEGSNLMQNYAVACDYPYYSDQSAAGTRPWASIIGCHASAFVKGITLINVPQATIAENLIYKREDATSLTTAISLTNCDLSDVHDNTIYNAATSYAAAGDFIGIAIGGATNSASVHHNKMDRVQVGVHLLDACQNTRTESNVVSTLYGSGVPQEYLNQSSGSGNTRVASPRFDTSQKNAGGITLNNASTTPLVVISPDTAEIGDEFLVTVLIHVTKDASPGGVKAYLAKTGGTAVPLFQSNLAQANGYCYLAAGTDGYISMSAVMKISERGSLTLTLSAATNAGGATLASGDAQISVVRR